MFRRVYVAFGALTLLIYAGVAISGYELGNPDRAFVPADVRQAPGGYRSFHFWHAGYRGGK